ncbi:transcriptional regulator [Rhodobacterales bacterium 52_120_T64]|nr:transcriptional regulator [Rhodobacterales bacterium 52_120_T64]
MRIGFDYGGTKIAGIAIGENGETLAELRVETPRFDYEAGVSVIQNATTQLQDMAGVKADFVGIGVPGSVDTKTGQISLGNSVWLSGQDLRGDVEAAVGVPVKIANDANCFALSEAVDGAGAGGSIVVGAILGTGVGGGIVVNGQLLTGANSISGEWGHMPLPTPRDDERPGPKCSCGHFGHTESWLSGPSLAADYARRAGIPIKGGPSVPEIVSMIESGDAIAEETFARFEDRLARSFAAIINVLDPDVIVLGGGVSNIGRLYETIPGMVKPYIFGDEFKTKIIRNMHGDSSGVRGAAWL